MREDVLIRALIHAGLATDYDVIRVLDSRLPHLPDPSWNVDRKHHTGTYPETFKEVWGTVRDRWLKDFIWMYKDALSEAHKKNAKRVIFFFYCKSGHHRSVALAYGMQHLLEATHGCLRPKVINTCEELWWTDCGHCKEPHACIYAHP